MVVRVSAVVVYELRAVRSLRYRAYIAHVISISIVRCLTASESAPCLERPGSPGASSVCQERTLKQSLPSFEVTYHHFQAHRMYRPFHLPPLEARKPQPATTGAPSDAPRGLPTIIRLRAYCCSRGDLLFSLTVVVQKRFAYIVVSQLVSVCISFACLLRHPRSIDVVLYTILDYTLS